MMTDSMLAATSFSYLCAQFFCKKLSSFIIFIVVNQVAYVRNCGHRITKSLNERSFLESAKPKSPMTSNDFCQ